MGVIGIFSRESLVILIFFFDVREIRRKDYIGYVIIIDFERFNK